MTFIKSKKLIAIIALIMTVFVLSCGLISCNRRDIQASTNESTGEPPTPPTNDSCKHVYDNDCDAECNLCGEISNVRGHKSEIILGQSPTCTQAGFEDGEKCSVCKSVLVEQAIIPALGHSEVEHIGKTPTCTEVGCEPYVTCTRCDYTTYSEISALGHDIEEYSDIEPTCTTDGYTGGSFCKVCNEIVEDRKSVSALGHDMSDAYSTDEHKHWQACLRCDEIDNESEHTFINEICSVCGYGCEHENIAWRIEREPTCSLEGKKVAVCSACNSTTELEILPKLPHTYGKEATCIEAQICTVCDKVLVKALGHDAVAIPAVEPTCTESGYTEGKVCSRCSEMLLETFKTAPLGHQIIKVSSIAPTCTEMGITEGEMCQRCHEVLTAQQTISPLGHKPTVDLGVPPTCTSSGLEDGEVCSVCNAVIKEKKVINALGHDEISHDGKGPTCTDVGYSSYVTCSRCNYTTFSEVPALGHAEISDEKISPTCTSDGYAGGTHCSRCGETITEATVIKASGHSYPSEYKYDRHDHWRICTVCSEKEISAHRDIDGYCKICGCKIIKVYNMNSVTSHYAVKGKAFDYISIDGGAIASATSSPSTVGLNEVEIMSEQTLSLQGWIGFKNKTVTSFAVFYDDEVEKAVILNEFKYDAEQAVINAGGQCRFNIYTQIGNLSGNGHSVSFAAVLDDGTYIVMKTLDIMVAGGDISIIPDDKVVKAEKESIDEEIKMTLVPTENKNEYITSAGFVFEASGNGLAYNTENKRLVFTKNGGLKINVLDSQKSFSEYFNKFKITYSSSAPLRVIVTYSSNGSMITDVVYMEAGENMLFACLTQGYLEGVYSQHVTSLDIHILGDAQNATFSLYNIETEKVDVIRAGTLTYLENQRYRLGIKLAWGGGISYLLDKNDNNAAIGNLINNADTGRLIQQSYYGTGNSSEYDCAYYNGTKWNYNPVQGGNVHNTASRIIDVEINERSIYIKAQPRDWAKTELAVCYMENVYTLYSDRIQVDNRFVDFAGYKYNPTAHQELPAFYTIGYLNTFVFYNGNSPWSNGALTYEASLPFWGGNSNAYFNMKKANTETWCAWINGATDYGIGLYTPNIDILLAGRHGYEASPDATNASDGACSYVAPLCSLRLVSYNPLEYSYLITSGSTKQIRDKFTQYKDFSDNSDLSSPEFFYSSGRK